jgi:transcriptional regulator with GAF, ATPase, and Fis domain
VESFVQEFSRTMKKSIESIPRSTLETLQQHHWPGNIRELRNVVERAMIVAQGDVLHPEVPQQARTSAATVAEALTLDEIQRQHILAVLEKTGWRISAPRGAAARLGLKPTTLEYRIRKLSISRPGNAPG